MDKKSIAGIVIVALIFLGFTFYNSHQQKKYQEQLMAYNAEQARIQAEQDSLLALNAPLPTADSAAIAAAGERLSGDSLQAQRRIMQFGELLAAAQQAAKRGSVRKNAAGSRSDSPLWAQYSPRKISVKCQHRPWSVSAQ